MSEEFTEAVCALREAAVFAQRTIGSLLISAFDASRGWFCPSSEYSGGTLLRFVIDDVDSIISLSAEASPALKRFEWWAGQLLPLLESAEGFVRSAEESLGNHRRFEEFSAKRLMMEDFRRNVYKLKAQIPRVRVWP